MQLPIPAGRGAHGLHALLDGLIRNWLLDTREFDLPVVGQQVLDVYLAGLGLGLGPMTKDTPRGP